MRSSRRGSTSSTISRFSMRPSVVTRTAISLPSRSGTNSMCSSRCWSGSGAMITAACCVRSREQARRALDDLVGRRRDHALADLVLLARGQPADLEQLSMKKRRPGRRSARGPADVWRCSSRPSSSRSAITLRTVAGDSPRSWRRVTVREPTASPPCRYSVTTACRIFCARRDEVACHSWSSTSLPTPATIRARDPIGHQKAAQSRADPAVPALGEAFGDQPVDDPGSAARSASATPSEVRMPEPGAIDRHLGRARPR